jgi:hypothetical protein
MASVRCVFFVAAVVGRQPAQLRPLDLGASAAGDHVDLLADIDVCQYRRTSIMVPVSGGRGKAHR